MADWLILTIGRDYRKFRRKFKRIDRVATNYILQAFEMVENLNQCRGYERLKRQKMGSVEETQRMQQDINAITITHGDEQSSSAKDAMIAELKQVVETKTSFVERQRRIIENQNDLIFKANEDKERMQRDVLSLKKEMEIGRSRKYLC